MKTKPYNQLTATQRFKVDNAISKAYTRVVSVVDTYEYWENEEKKATVFNDSVDIFFYHVSNMVERYTFNDKLKALLKEQKKENYISNKL
jgi:hypothetical protein